MQRKSGVSPFTAGSVPCVYFLPWDRREELPSLLEVSGLAGVIDPGDMVAVKMHFGEKGNDGFVKPEFIRPVLKMIRSKKAEPFLTDTGTIYNGQRTDAVSHLKLAGSHGFSQTRLQTPIIIADGLVGNNYEEVEINGKHFRKVKIAKAIVEANAIISVAHFKGHMLAGFGGSIKNLGMGCAARLGKFEMHSSVSPEVTISLCKACGACVLRCAQGALLIVNGKVSLNTTLCKGCGECVVACRSKALQVNWEKGPLDVQERFAEYALGAVKNKRAFFLNFINHITPNCDCMSKNETPLLPDVGIMASKDPVAVDGASLDMIKKTAGDVFIKVYPRVDSSVQLRHAEDIGLGTRKYKLIEI